MLPDLTDFIHPADGGFGAGLPGGGALLTIRQDEMHDHPFIVAQEVFVFAGPDAQAAHDAYISGDGIGTGQFVVTVYRIESTVIGEDGIGTMTIRREL